LYRSPEKQSKTKIISAKEKPMLLQTSYEIHLFKNQIVVIVQYARETMANHTIGHTRQAPDNWES